MDYISGSHDELEPQYLNSVLLTDLLCKYYS